MSQTREKEIHGYLMDKFQRSIVRFCKDAHSSLEIVRFATPRQTSDPDWYETRVAETLKLLEDAKIVEYREGKWKTASSVLPILKKYFGES